MRKIRCSIFVLLLISLVLPVSSQAASMKTKGRVHLKINQYYVLYAAPKEPYLLNGRLYLPLRSVSQLLGAKVDYDGKRKWVKIQLNNHVLEINMMTNQTFYDSAEIQTDVKPQYNQQSLFVPIRDLVDGLKVNGTWDQKRQMLIVTDESLKKTPTFINIEEFDRTTVYDQEAFFPLSYTFESKKEKNTHSMSLTVTAKNISGKDIPAGDEYLHPLYLYSSGAFSYDRKKANPEVKKDEVITRTWKRTELESFQYILFEGITGEDYTIDLP